MEGLRAGCYSRRLQNGGGERKRWEMGQVMPSPFIQDWVRIICNKIYSSDYNLVLHPLLLPSYSPIALIISSLNLPCASSILYPSHTPTLSSLSSPSLDSSLASPFLVLLPPLIFSHQILPDLSQDPVSLNIATVTKVNNATRIVYYLVILLSFATSVTRISRGDYPFAECFSDT